MANRPFNQCHWMYSSVTLAFLNVLPQGHRSLAHCWSELILPFTSLQDTNAWQELCWFLTLSSSCDKLSGCFNKAHHRWVVGPQHCSKGKHSRLLSCHKTLPQCGPKTWMLRLWWRKLRGQSDILAGLLHLNRLLYKLLTCLLLQWLCNFLSC